MLTLPLKMSNTQNTVWGDLDLVAVEGEIPITIISCKTSLHGRLTETLFWSLLFRMLTRTKIVLATPDAGAGRPEELRSEWGTEENPSKDRLLAESYLDGVYVENVPEFCKLQEPTALGGVIRPLNELPDDIKRWAEEISRFIRGRNSF
ncbi:MAG: BsaWI family type II restriction enzyme [Candidatus Bathyarchaeia archaeon]